MHTELSRSTQQEGTENIRRSGRISRLFSSFQEMYDCGEAVHRVEKQDYYVGFSS